MKQPRKPVRDPKLAGEWARKAFGPGGAVKIRTASAPRVRSRWDVYEVGVVSPEDGYFAIRGRSNFDFSEAFHLAGVPMDVRDPLFLRHETTAAARREESALVDQGELF